MIRHGITLRYFYYVFLYIFFCSEISKIDSEDQIILLLFEFFAGYLYNTFFALT